MLGFPLKDLARRRNQTILSVLALSMCVTAIVFLVIVIETVGLEITSIAEGKLNIGFTRVFSDFATIIIILSVVTGAVLTYFLTSITMTERRKDIGIMKSAGCLTEVVFGHFATEISVIILLSCIIGTGFGTFLSVVYVSLNKTGFISHISFNFTTLIIILLIFALVSYLLGIRPIVKAIKAIPAESLAQHKSYGTSLHQKSTLSTKLNLSIKIAYRTLHRRKKSTLVTVVCFILVMTSTTLTVAGSTVVNETTQSYLKRAIGENVVLIGHSDIADQYKTSLSKIFQNQGSQEMNFFDSNYMIPETLVTRIGEIPRILKLDTRLVFETIVNEVQGVIFIDDNGKRPVLLGDHRFSLAFIQAVNPEQVINDWYLWGRTLNQTDSNAVVIGDSLSSRIISYPYEQRIEILNERFNIAGVVLDPFNQGLVVYAPYEFASSLLNQTGHNLLMIQVDSVGYLDTLERVKLEIYGTDFVLLELDEIISQYLDFFDLAWSPYAILSLLFLGAIVFCLFNYTALCMADQEQDLCTMRAIGVTPKRIVGIVFTQTSLMATAGGVIGIFLGFLITFAFFIPEPVIGLSNIMLISSWLLLALSLISVSGSYTVFRVLRKTIASSMSNP